MTQTDTAASETSSLEMAYQAVVNQITGNHRFLVGCHRAPDADAFGSALGLCEVLKRLEKEFVLLVPDGVPNAFRFLPGAENTKQSLEDNTPAFDACFFLDLAAGSLIPEGFADPAIRGVQIVVDHHAYHDSFGDVVLRDVNAAATGTVVFQLAEKLRVPTSGADIAAPLYAAIMSDTGGFRFSNTSAQTLRTAASLVEGGADPASISQQIFAEWEPVRIELMREALGRLRFSLEGRVATMVLDRALLDSLAVPAAMVEGFVDFGRSVRGVEVSVFLWEQTKEGVVSTRMSLRSRGQVNVAEVAKAFGGGGHKLAAGATIEARATDIVESVARSIETALQVH